MKYHLIIGFGKWSKKIISFLQKKKLFYKIYIKTRHYYFELGSMKKIHNKEFDRIQKKIDSIHICTPVKSHYFYIKKFSKIKRIIVEKPFLTNLSQLKKIENIYSSKTLLLVNYTYLFSPIFNNLTKEVYKKTNDKIIINFSKKNNFYKKKYDSINDWLDHPLSIILYLFKNFSEFKIIKKEFVKKKGFYEKVIINYLYDNLIVQIKINTSTINTKNIIVINNSKKKVYDFNSNSIFLKKKKIFKSNKSSFENLYFVLKNNKKISFQNFNFHKKIIAEKNKIIRKIKK